MNTRSFFIPASNKSLVDDHIIKLNRRGSKLGLPEISVLWGKAYLVNNILMIPADLTGPLKISYEGWEFIATLQHLPTGENIIRAITDAYEIPLEYRESGSACEHCNVKRYRKDTYVVRHDETEEAKQVGSTCIKDFLGGNSPDNIMQKASFIGELISFMEGIGREPQGNDEGIFYIIGFLAQTSAVIREHGWLSKSDASKNGGTSTASIVQDNYRPELGYKKSKVTPEDTVLATEAAEWAENLSDAEVENSDYLYNIRAIARSGMVGWRTVGFAASIISSYRRSHPISQPKIEDSSFVGEIKQREIFDLTVKKISGFTGSYGYTNKYIFNDKLGNVLVWLTSVAQDFEEGKRYSIKGTVKAHEEFANKKQTIITRCEVLAHY